MATPEFLTSPRHDIPLVRGVPFSASVMWRGDGMKILDRLLERMLVEELPGSPTWESTWWTDTVFRGLQEGDPGESGVDGKRDAASPTPS